MVGWDGGVCEGIPIANLRGSARVTVSGADTRFAGPTLSIR